MHRNILPFVPYRFVGRPVSCPVCGSDRHTTVGSMDRRLKPLRTVLCEECGTFFSNPMPTEAELALYYRNEYRLDYQFAAFRPSRRHVRKKVAEAERRYESLSGLLTGAAARILDVGCGSGELVREFARHGHRAVGLEPGETYAEHARTQIGGDAARIDRGAWQESDYAPNSFDVITMLHVLEHLPDPVAALRKVHLWLADDGRFLVEVPNMQAYCLKGFERFHFAHVLGFSRDNLIHAARQAGFAVETEFGPTSLLLRKAKHGACTAIIDLAATARKNRREYGAPFSLRAYLAYHARRARHRLWRARPLGA